MNRDNIQYTIDTLKAAQNFNIFHFQRTPRNRAVPYGKYAETIEELHTCGNTACIAGYMGLTQRWRDLGGLCHQGMPGFPDLSDDEIKRSGHDCATASFVRFWGLQPVDVDAIIYGDNWLEFREAFVGLPEGWAHMTKEHAVSLFEQMLAKEPA